jgi:hypothetical protein
MTRPAEPGCGSSFTLQRNRLALDELVAGVVDPHWDRHPTVWTLVGGEGAADRGGGEVGAVGGEDALEVVGAPSAGGADVEVAAGGGLSGEVDADIHGVALGTVLGRRIPQPDVLPHVVGGQSNLTVTLDRGHGERTIGVDAGDRPDERPPNTGHVGGKTWWWAALFVFLAALL